MNKLLLTILISATSIAQFELRLENYETFGGSLKVSLKDVRAQVISQSSSNSNKKCFKKTGWWSSDSVPYEAKQNIKVAKSGNTMMLKSAQSSWEQTRKLIKNEIPANCQVMTNLVVLVKAYDKNQKEFLLHGEVLNDGEFYFRSGDRYDFLNNENVSMVAMPPMPAHIKKQVWDALSPKNLKIETNF